MSTACRFFGHRAGPAMWDRWFDYYRMRPLVWRVVHCERCGDVLECRRIGAE